MAKKNRKRFLTKAGSTMAVAVAMTVALSAQAHAAELDETALQPTEIPPADEMESNNNLNPNEMEPAEYNGAVNEENKKIVNENQNTAGSNDQTAQNNDAAAENNETITDGELVNPDVNLPDAPDAPDTEGMDVADYNDAVDEYNKNVDDYNGTVDEYNKNVDDYNDAAYAYDQQAQEKFEEDKTAYDDAKTEHEEAEKQHQKELEQYNKDSEAYQKYLEEKAAYDKAYADYLAELEKFNSITKPDYDADSAEYQKYLEEKAAYDKAYTDYLAEMEKFNKVTKPEYDADSAEYQKYLEEKAAYDKAYADYLAELEKFNSITKPEYDADSAEYQKYLEEKAAYDKAYTDYLAEQEKFNKVTKPDYDADSAEYQKYLEEKAAYDKAYTDYLAELEKFNKVTLPAYTEKVEQSDMEQAILDDVNKYNDEVAEKNQQIEQDNALLENDLDVGVVENLEEVGAINQNVIIDDEILTALSSFDKLAEEQAALVEAGKALANHAGKSAELGSEAYAEYLATVAEYNAGVDAFNQKVAAYNAAVEAYNAAVDTYNANKEDLADETTTGTGTQQGDGSTTDWGNVNIDDHTVGHVDVKYQAAASKDVQKDDAGNISYSDTVTQYTVTGVYTDEAAADNGNSTDYGLVYDNDGSGEQPPGEQELNKDASYAEFGSNHFGDNATYTEADSLDTAKSYYIQNGYYGYQEIKYDARTGRWKTVGYNSQNINVGNRAVYERKAVDMSPAEGTVSFYVTLKDSENETHGINVNLDADSVYAKGSYYKAKYNNRGEESDFLHEFYTVDGKGQKQYLPVVWIENENGVKEKHYDISGQSVFLISALTCDGMTNGTGGTLNPDGLDLILNLQTMIEIHQSDSAKKVSFLNYELEKYAATDDQSVTDPGDAPEAPTFNKTEPDPVENPGEAPEAPTFNETEPDPVDDPGEAPEAPTFNETEPDPVDNPGEAPETPTFNETEPDPVDNPGEAPEAPTFNETEPDPVDDPGEAPEAPTFNETEPDPVEDPGEAPEGPGEFTETEPEAPVPAERLEHVDPLEKLEKKLTILFDDPVDPPNPDPVDPPNPDPVDPPAPEPVPIDDLLEIPDEEVPLASAPKTGDVSMLWTALSSLSAVGMFFLGRKRKDEEA